MGNLNVNASVIEADAAGISGAARYFRSQDLSPVDSRTKITANEKSKTAFSNSQNSIVAFGSALTQDAANIRSLNVAFAEFDEMMGALAKNG